MAGPRGRPDNRPCDPVLVSNLRLAGLLLVAAFLSVAQERSRQPGSGDGLPWVFVQAPEVAALNAIADKDRFPRGSRIVLFTPPEQGGKVLSLTPDFWSAADPQVSFDGKSILFAGRRAKRDSWQIWEMEVDGRHKRRLTSCAGDCLKPAYLPGNRIAFTQVRWAGNRPQGRVRVAQRDGSGAHPITFGRTSFELASVLRDGRLLLLGRHSWGGSQNGSSVELYTVWPDGTGLASLRCEHDPNVARTTARETEDGSIVFIKSSYTDASAGALAEIARGSQGNSVFGGAEGLYLSVQPLRHDEFVVAWRPGRTGSRSATHPSRYELRHLERTKSGPGRLMYRHPRLHSFDAVPVAAHPQPRLFPSILNRSKKTGTLIGLNSYLSSTERLVPGSIQKVRVLAQDEVAGGIRILGVAPVAADGSFFLEVPADTPLRLELLDASERPLAAQKSWFWVRPGENRACVGCHEDRALAPENTVPQILSRKDVPFRLTGQGTPERVAQQQE